MTRLQSSLFVLALAAALPAGAAAVVPAAAPAAPAIAAPAITAPVRPAPGRLANSFPALSPTRPAAP